MIGNGGIDQSVFFMFCIRTEVKGVDFHCTRGPCHVGV